MTRPAKARYLMIGGFLGAGKTTAVSRLAGWLRHRGVRVGLITNDQGRDLVDTAILRSEGFATEEIPCGCFCCRFDSLLGASRRLIDTARPEVFIAEPVGSCTDLAATVTYPLRRLYGEDFTVAPVSVLVDPIRARRVLGLESGDNFTDKVLYIYLKQIEEADLVVISKCDLLDSTRLEALRQAIAAKFPGKEILAVSARAGINLEAWFARITQAEQVARTAMPVDYQVYGDGEALLGWLNCSAHLSAQQPFPPDDFLEGLAGTIQQRLQSAKAQVAHLKMTLAPDSNPTGRIATVNLVRNDFAAEASTKLGGSLTGGRLLLNLRAEAAPEMLSAIVREALHQSAAAFPTLSATVTHFEHFRPGKPNPTHRIEGLPACYGQTPLLL